METPLKTASIKIPRELLEAINRIAEENKTTRNTVIRRALSRYMEMLETLSKCMEMLEKSTITIPKSKEKASKKMIATTFKIHTEDLERLNKIAKEMNISRNTLIRWAIKHYIETQIEKPKEKHIVIKI
jgi:predicted transcriptional regulator